QGHVTMPSMEIAQYACTHVTAPFEADNLRLRFSDIQCSFYKGRFQGEIIVDYAPQMAYSMNMHIQGVDLTKLAYVNPGVFEQVKGIVRGDVFVKGSGEQLNAFKAGF